MQRKCQISHTLKLISSGKRFFFRRKISNFWLKKNLSVQTASVQASVFSCQISSSWNSQCVKVKFRFFQDLIVWNVLNTQPQWSEVDMKINPFGRHFSLPRPHPLMWRKKLNFRGGDNGISFPVIQSDCVLILPAFFILWCGPGAVTIGAHTEEGSTGTKWETQNVSHQNKNRLKRGGVEMGGK